MKTLLACIAIYVAALCMFVWLIMPAKKPPAFVPANVQFCQDWRDGQASLCDRIPFRKEVAI
jgi:hypothetical protein